MKYVMFQCTYSGGLVQKVPFIFPEFMVHADVAEYMKVMMLREHKMTDVRPVSAGFVNLGGEFTSTKGKVGKIGGVHVYGDSETLKLKHDPNDAAVLDFYQYTNGVVS